MTSPTRSENRAEARSGVTADTGKKMLKPDAQFDLFDVMNGSDEREAMEVMDLTDSVIGKLDKLVAEVTAANPGLAALVNDSAADVNMAMYLRSGGASLESVNELITSTSDNPTAVMAVVAIADATASATVAYDHAKESLGQDFALHKAPGSQAGKGDVKTPAKRGRKKIAETSTDAEPLSDEDRAAQEIRALSEEAAAEDAESESAADDTDDIDDEKSELTPREEILRESKRDKLENAKAMQGILNRLGGTRYEPPTPDQEYALGMRARSGDDDARTELIERNTRYLVRIAARFTKTGRSLEELFQAGSFGLIRAAELFEPEKGFRFTTYADAWIRQHISRYITNDELIRTPMHVVDKEVSIRKRSREALSAGDSALSATLGKEADEMRRDRASAGSFMPMDDPLGGEDDRTLHDLLPSDAASLEQSSEAKKIVGWLLRAADNTETPMHGQIFKMKLGLHPDHENDPLTLLEISEIFAISRERVRQIFDKSMIEISKSVIYWAKGVHNLPANFFPTLKATYGREENLKASDSAGILTHMVDPNGSNDDRTLLDLLASEEVSLEQASEAKKLVAWLLRAADNTENPMHGEIFKMRLGLHPDHENDPLTIMEISEIFSFSKQQVLQIFEKSMAEISESVIYWAKGVDNLPNNFFPTLKATYGRS